VITSTSMRTLVLCAIVAGGGAAARATPRMTTLERVVREGGTIYRGDSSPTCERSRFVHGQRRWRRGDFRRLNDYDNYEIESLEDGSVRLMLLGTSIGTMDEYIFKSGDAQVIRLSTQVGMRLQTTIEVRWYLSRAQCEKDAAAEAEARKPKPPPHWTPTAECKPLCAHVVECKTARFSATDGCESACKEAELDDASAALFRQCLGAAAECTAVHACLDPK